MLTMHIPSFPRPIALWGWLSAGPRDLARHWAVVRLRRRTIDQLAKLSDHQLRDLGVEESPYHEGALRDACNMKARLADRWTPNFLPEARAQRWL